MICNFYTIGSYFESVKKNRLLQQNWDIKIHISMLGRRDHIANTGILVNSNDQAFSKKWNCSRLT
jgi:hypothetical protein